MLLQVASMKSNDWNLAFNIAKCYINNVKHPSITIPKLIHVWLRGSDICHSGYYLEVTTPNHQAQPLGKYDLN